MTVTPWSDAARALVGAAFGDPELRAKNEKQDSDIQLNDARIGQANAQAAADQLQAMLRQQQYDSLDPTYGAETMQLMGSDPTAAMGRMLATDRNPMDFITGLSALEATAPNTSDLEADRLGRRALIGSAKNPGEDFAASLNMAEDVASRKASEDNAALAGFLGIPMPAGLPARVGLGTSSYAPMPEFNPANVGPHGQGSNPAMVLPYDQIVPDDALSGIPAVSDAEFYGQRVAPVPIDIRNVPFVEDVMPPTFAGGTAPVPGDGFGQLIQSLTAPEAPAQLTTTPGAPQATELPDLLNDPSTPNKLALYGAMKGDDGFLRLAETMNQNRLAKETNAKLPPAVSAGYLENTSNIKKVEDALSLLDGGTVDGPDGIALTGSKDATGLQGYLPDAVLQRTDPEGVATRAAIADIGSLKIHDRSGASVTISESPRLMPFIPSANDEPDAVKTKLTKLLLEYKNMQQEMDTLYGGQGYNVPERPGTSGGPVQIQNDAEYDTLPSGTQFIAPDGTTRTKP